MWSFCDLRLIAAGLQIKEQVDKQRAEGVDVEAKYCHSTVVAQTTESLDKLADGTKAE